MNADRLLEHFERISDAADAVPRLRRFVLDLAVRGALVAARTSDAPADVPDAANRPPQGKAVELPIDSLPFTVPSTWRWAYLTEVADVLYGFAFASGRFNASRHGMPLIRIRDISSTDTEAYFDGEYEDRYVVRNGDYLIGMDGDFNVRKWAGRDALLNQRVLRINNWHSQAAAGWCAIPLPMILDHIHGQTSQTTVKHLSAKQMNGVRIPLPPLAEQHRIVAKVDELMALCDRLEAAQTEREARRDRLVSASLARVTEPDSANATSTTTSARFHLDHFARLTTRPEHVKQLRQTILNLAVRGRLVHQDHSETSFAVSSTADLSDDPEKRLEMSLPSGWQWVRVRDVAEARLGKMLDKAKNRGRQYPYLRNTNVHWFEVRTDELKTMPLADDEVDSFLLHDGDVLICEGGHGIARTAVWRGEISGVAFQKALHRVRSGTSLNGDFFAFCINVYFHANILQRLFTGVGIPHFTGVALSKLVFPLPPLAEQRRIVAKVDELMALCDQLEASLASAATDQAQLLEALLHEALVPAA